MTASNNPDLLQTKEAAQELKVSTRTVARYIKQGHLTARKLPSGRVLVEVASIARFKTGTPALAEGGTE
ncbi:helix-turn-helix domain-containing protein [Cryobacterium sp. MDB1-18-2]|uniref:helix-turn-helix domain-containing protein n=1 Tax=unclassified Cryobacterium TaxID=2649013 RepID=UPI00106D0666|nr:MULTISPECIES: helix-turn-helix domain-containing protein [unclassified Cryobacterium]TFC30081.1 helix-turn-helix domain-containing protein [Cryobacterium sp. MDB1-18-2]TFC41361.1 helix-turn-helix domain-containing protein [Cryobacterium sp. MDB1-18-1]